MLYFRLAFHSGTPCASESSAATALATSSDEKRAKKDPSVLSVSLNGHKAVGKDRTELRKANLNRPLTWCRHVKMSTRVPVLHSPLDEFGRVHA